MSAKKIEVLGTGCPKCKTLEASAREAVQRLGWATEIVKVAEIEEIVRRGVMTTPALVVDGKTLSVGRALRPAEVEELLREGAES